MNPLVWLALAGAVISWPPRPNPSAGNESAGRTRPPVSAAALAAVASIAVAAMVLSVGGLGSLPVAVLAGGLSYWLVRRLPAVGEDPGTDPALPLVLDLVAAALRAGRTIPDAVRLAAPAAGPVLCRGLRQVAGLLELGERPEQAWTSLGTSGVLAEVARAAARSSQSGARLAETCVQAAFQVRAGNRVRSEVGAARAGTYALAPLGLCFLPAFVCLGVVPVVIGILAHAWNAA